MIDTVRASGNGNDDDVGGASSDERDESIDGDDDVDDDVVVVDVDVVDAGGAVHWLMYLAAAKTLASAKQVVVGSVERHARKYIYRKSTISPTNADRSQHNANATETENVTSQPLFADSSDRTPASF